MTPRSAIPRHKTALHRDDLSRPMKCALRDGLVTASTTVFDYGCGRGADVAVLRDQGIACDGWDPVHQPDTPPRPADVVQLGYVLNVIEDTAERAATLARAWGFARTLLVVAAQVNVPGRGASQVAFGDGVLTRLGTFQKFFGQAELQEYVEATLGAEAVPAEPGVFYVFRHDDARQQFLARRYRRAAAVPRQRVSEARFAAHRDLLEALMAVVADLGRVPEPDEFPRAVEVAEAFGSLNRAFALVRRVTGPDEWAALRRRRTEDYQVYLALARFRGRPPLGALPRLIRRDIREFFGAYTEACRQGDDLLFRAGSADAIDAACKRAAVGKLLPNALYVHRSAVGELEPLLRVYEGCARAYVGEVAGTTLVKLHRFSGKVSYLAYADFDADPHPALVRSVKLSLRTRGLECLEYGASENPPVLHRKEAFVGSGYPGRETFARLTAQEEKAGLLDDTATIGTRNGWLERLRGCGYSLRGHRLVRAKS